MSRVSPIRTCVGCRQRVVAGELLRVVVAPDVTAPAASGALVPDPRRRMPGRGAWVHPEPACVELAQRRRAFARALRVPGTIDPEPVNEYVARERNDVTVGQPVRRNTAGDDEQ